MSSEHTKDRWGRFGPYYAMFPVSFAYNVIEEHSKTGDAVLDPFAGRGTSLYAAAALGRESCGIEINPVGWVYGKTKLKPAKMKSVLGRLEQIADMAAEYQAETDALPDFFQVCFSKQVLMFLLAARANLNWKQNNTDRTLASFILYYLHGDREQSLSNQMKQTISMSPQYSIRWWRRNGCGNPPEIDAHRLLRSRIEWRYEKGMPNLDGGGEFFLGDSEKKLATMSQKDGEQEKYSLLLTSPPYRAVINYHADQWLRLWVLGGEPKPTSRNEQHRGRFDSKERYRELLSNVFSQCARLMQPNGTIYVRTDVREFTFQCTKEVLAKCFPQHQSEVVLSTPERTQSILFKNVPSMKPGERDIILTPH